MEGWIKLHRKILDNPIVCKDADYLAVWIYLLLKASHNSMPAIFKGKKIELAPGQLITGRKKIAEDLHINESKVKRILLSFKSDQQIDQQISNKNSLITVLNWGYYQKSEHQNDQQVTSERPASDQRTATNKNIKNDKNEKKDIKDIVPSGTSLGQTTGGASGTSLGFEDYDYKAVVDYLNLKAGTSFRCTSKDTRKHIKDRFDEGFTLQDFKRVIDVKSAEWAKEPDAGEKDMRPYLRPSTLFGDKFESYLNQQEARKTRRNKFNNFPQRDNGNLFAKLETINTGGSK